MPLLVLPVVTSWCSICFRGLSAIHVFYWSGLIGTYWKLLVGNKIQIVWISQSCVWHCIYALLLLLLSGNNSDIRLWEHRGQQISRGTCWDVRFLPDWRRIFQAAPSFLSGEKHWVRTGKDWDWVRTGKDWDWVRTGKDWDWVRMGRTAKRQQGTGVLQSFGHTPVGPIAYSSSRNLHRYQCRGRDRGRGPKIPGNGISEDEHTP